MNHTYMDNTHDHLATPGLSDSGVFSTYHFGVDGKLNLGVLSTTNHTRLLASICKVVS